MLAGPFASLIAEATFWATLILGAALGEIRVRGCVLFASAWALGFFGLPRMSSYAAVFVTPYVAALDIVLALVVFKGDVRLS